LAGLTTTAAAAVGDGPEPAGANVKRFCQEITGDPPIHAGGPALA